MHLLDLTMHPFRLYSMAKMQWSLRKSWIIRRGHVGGQRGGSRDQVSLAVPCIRGLRDALSLMEVI